MNEDIRAMLEHIVVQARKNLEMSGRLLPVAFIFGGDKTVHIVGCPWADAKDKEEMVAGLRNFCREKQAQAIAILAEAWAVKQSEMVGDDPPADQPKRTEIISIYVETLDGFWIAHSDITRTDGKPSFGELKFEPMTDERLPNERFQKFLA